VNIGSFWVHQNFSQEVLGLNPLTMWQDVLDGKFDNLLRSTSKQHTWMIFDLHENAAQKIVPSQSSWAKDASR
jgi:hypothetical protein